LVKITKKWANLVFSIFFIFHLFTFPIWENIIQISLGKTKKTVPFPRVEVLLMQKKPKCTFFRSEEVLYNYWYERAKISLRYFLPKSQYMKKDKHIRLHTPVVRTFSFSRIPYRGRFHQRSTYSFYARRSQMRKKRQSSQHCHFMLLGSASIKVVRRMLMKSTPVRDTRKGKGANHWCM